MSYVLHAGPAHHSANPALALEFCRLGSVMLALPFDMAREQYAKSVRAGLIERSLLASARFEQSLTAMERCLLGGMARSY